MRTGKKEKKQVKLVDDWNIKHPVGIDVIVTKDDQTEQRTKTRSAAWMLGSCGDYPGHTAVIMLDGISGAMGLERVRVAELKDYIKGTETCPECYCGAMLPRDVKFQKKHLEQVHGVKIGGIHA